MMNADQWRRFLQEWSRDLLASPDAVHFDVPREARTGGWLGFEPASPEEIAAAERRLKITFPNSYRAFLGVTNGWRQTGTFIDRILPVQEIRRVRASQPEIVEAWSFDREYAWLHDAIALTEGTEGDAYLLNPQAVGENGEMEAWLFGTEDPSRFPSFEALMWSERENFGRLESHADRSLRSSADVAQANVKLDELVRELTETADRYAQTPMYRSAAEVIRSYADKVRALSDKEMDSERAIAELDAMAQEAETKLGAGPPARKVTPATVLTLLSGHGAGDREGYRKAGGVIRWFLNR